MADWWNTGTPDVDGHTHTLGEISDEGTAAILDSIDEDDMVSDSAVHVPTQQSVKAYVDSNATAVPGDEWTSRTPAENNYWQDVAYGNGMFVSVAETGTNRVMWSPDGVTWNAASAASADGWYSVVYGNGLFVAVAYYGGGSRLMTSSDGKAWTSRTAPESNSWQSVAYGNGLFVAVSNSGTNRVMTSPDGITWTARSASEANGWKSVTYGNGVFVAVSGDGTNRVMSSTDGITWTARSAAAAATWSDVTYGNGTFVAVASSAVDANRVMTSPDGITWTLRASTGALDWQNVTYGEGRFVAGASSGTDRIMTSPDGITWTARTLTTSVHGLAYGDGVFVAITYSSPYVRTSGTKQTNNLLNEFASTVIDDDTMAIASSSSVATSESVKAYVDANGGGTVQGTDGTYDIQPANEGATAGNARGESSVDFQTERNAATQVASGAEAVISGGYRNTASGEKSTVSGGKSNVASGYQSVVGGGGDHTASGISSVVAGGALNTATGNFSTVGGGNGVNVTDDYSVAAGGRQNTVSSGESFLGGGWQNTVSGNGYGSIVGGFGNASSKYASTIGGGYSNSAAANYSTIPGGFQALADKVGQLAYAGGQFAAKGDAQTSLLVARNSTADATPTELFLDGSSSRCTIATDTTWMFTVSVVARRTDADGESAAYEIKGCLDSNAGTVALVGSVTKTVLAEDNAVWDCTVTADDTNDALKIEVTGEAAKTIRWVARIELTEVSG